MIGKSTPDEYQNSSSYNRANQWYAIKCRLTYDTKMEEGASLGVLSLLMKGVTLPAWTPREGIPARPVEEIAISNR